jgi:hypothetical protein
MKLRNSLAALEMSPSQLDHSRLSSSVDSLKRFLKVRGTKLRLPLVLSLLLAGPVFALGQQPATRLISFPVTIQWTRQKGVAKYRIQIANDESFRNIFFDARVNGERYTASGLPPGYYYWRAAPADFSTGRFSTAVRFFVSGGAAVSPVVPDKGARRSRVRSTTNNH